MEDERRETVYDRSWFGSLPPRLAASIRSCGTRIIAYIIRTRDDPTAEPQGAPPVQPPTMSDQGGWIVDIPGTIESPSSPSSSSDDSRSRASLLRMHGPQTTTGQGMKPATPQTELPIYHARDIPPRVNHDQNQIWHPIIILFRELELGRHVLVLTVPMTTGLLAVYNPNSASLLVCLTALAVSIGFTATWNGILLRQTFPRTANAIEQLGVAFILLAFFGLVGSFLPANLGWAPGLCFCLSLLPFFIAFTFSIGRAP